MFTDTGQVLKYLRLSKIKFLLVFLLLGSLSNDDGDGNDNGKKAIGLDSWQNNNFARASRFFGLTILRNETKYMGEGGKVLIYLNTV